MKRVIISSTYSSRWTRDKDSSITKYVKDYANGYGILIKRGQGFYGKLVDANDDIVYEYETASGVYEYREHVQTILDKAAKEYDLN